MAIGTGTAGSTGGSTTGGSSGILFEFSDLNKWSKVHPISAPEMLFAVGLGQFDNLFLHYASFSDKCEGLQDTRVTICGCDISLNNQNNVLILPWAGTWMLEYTGAGAGFVSAKPMNVGWDTALEMFMKQAMTCCNNGCSGCGGSASNQSSDMNK